MSRVPVGRRWLRWAWLPLAAAVAGALAAAWVSGRQPNVYRATVTLVAGPSTRVEDVSNVLRALEALERRSILATMAKIPATAGVRDSVARQLGVAADQIAAYSVRATVLPHVNALAIEVLGPDPERCREVAAAAGATTRRRVRELYPVYALRELEPARASRQPVSPNVRRDAGLASLLGFFLGALALAAWSALPVSRRTL